jgi:8-hydroxy-5-deazaflavin:NADPH oxidoreductase
VQDAGFDPVLVGPLTSAKQFDQGAPLYGKVISAREMRQMIESIRGTKP